MPNGQLSRRDSGSRFTDGLARPGTRKIAGCCASRPWQLPLPTTYSHRQLSLSCPTDALSVGEPLEVGAQRVCFYLSVFGCCGAFVEALSFVEECWGTVGQCPNGSRARESDAITCKDRASWPHRRHRREARLQLPDSCS